MSRSKKNRKLKFGGFFHWVSFKSNKKDKTITNRIMRRTNKIRIKLGQHTLDKLKEVRDIYNFDSDGKAYYMTYNKQNRYPETFDSCGHSIYSNSPWDKEDINRINRK